MIILRDDFTGTGDLTAHTPNTPMFGSGWTDLSGGDAPYFIPFGLSGGEARPRTEGDYFSPRAAAQYSAAWAGKPLGSLIPGSAAKQSVNLEVGAYHHAYSYGSEPTASIQLFTPFTGAATSSPSGAGIVPGLGVTALSDDGLYLLIDRQTPGEFPAIVSVAFGIRIEGVETYIFSATLMGGDAYGDIELSSTLFDPGVHTFRGEFNSSVQNVFIDGLLVWTGSLDFTSLTRSVRGLALSHMAGENHLTGGPAGGRLTGIDYVQVEASGVTASDFWTAFRGSHEVLEAP